jgi:hypothetical protein
MSFEDTYAKLPFDQKMQVHEVNVRGTYLSIACDSERLMDDLISLCELDIIFPTGFDKINDEDVIEEIRKYKIKKITWVEMGKKLFRCKQKLEKYNKSYFDSFSKYFEDISDLVQDRNLMAHGYSDYDIQQEAGKIFILFENVVHGKREEKIIEVKTFLSNLETHRKGIMELIGLTVQIRAENFGKRHIA